MFSASVARGSPVIQQSNTTSTSDNPFLFSSGSESFNGFRPVRPRDLWLPQIRRQYRCWAFWGTRGNIFHPFSVSFLFLRQYFDPPKMSNDDQPNKLPVTLRDSDFASRLELWLSTSLIGVVTEAAVVAPINYGCGRILQLPPSPSIEWSLVGKFLSFNQ